MIVVPAIEGSPFTTLVVVGRMFIFVFIVFGEWFIINYLLYTLKGVANFKGSNPMWGNPTAQVWGYISGMDPLK